MDGSEKKKYNELTYHIEIQENGQPMAVIDKCKSEARELYIPASIDGAPVRKIATLCFYDESQLQDLYLPESIFYMEFSLPDHKSFHVHMFHHIQERENIEDQLVWKQGDGEKHVFWENEREWEGYLYFVDGGKASIVGHKEKTWNTPIPSVLDGAPVVEICEEAFYMRITGESRVCIPDTVRFIGDRAFSKTIIGTWDENACFVLSSGIEKIGRDTFTDSMIYDFDEYYPRERGRVKLEIHPGQENLKGFPWGAGKYEIQGGVPLYEGSITTAPFLKAGDIVFLKEEPEYDYHEEIQPDGSKGIIMDGCSDNVVLLRIPGEIDGVPVTAIAENAFGKNRVLEEVYIPDTIMRIGKNAFRGCREDLYVHMTHRIQEKIKRMGLEKEQIIWEGERWHGEYNVAFRILGEYRYFIDRGQVGILEYSHLNRLKGNIPGSYERAPVVEICEEAFAFVWIEKKDGRIYLPDTVLYIGNFAFEYAQICCMTEEKPCLVLPSGIRIIGKKAFENIGYQWFKDGDFYGEPLKKGKAGVEIDQG